MRELVGPYQPLMENFLRGTEAYLSRADCRMGVSDEDGGPGIGAYCSAK